MWLDWINDLHQWKYSRRLFAACFLLAIVATVDIVITQYPLLLTRFKDSDRNLFGLLMAIELLSLLGAVFLWVGMIVHCMWSTRRGVFSKLLWGVCFMLGIWWTAGIYYLVSYPNSQTVSESTRTPGE